MREKRKVWLEALRTSPSTVRKAIFMYGPDNAVLAICELALNYSAGNIKAKLSRAQRDNVVDLADRTISLQRKRKYLIKPSGLKLSKALLEV